MSASNDMISCIGCGASVPDIDYPVSHQERYPEARSPGCWKIFCEDILVREYSEWNYPSIHRLTVDSYAAQHPGRETPQTTQSVIVHLTALNLVLNRDFSFEMATEKMGQLIEEYKDDFSWLEPPENRGDITVIDVAGAHDLEEHTELVRDWARSVWEAWEQHHSTLEQWTQRAAER
jgi:hypothetical protein